MKPLDACCEKAEAVLAQHDVRQLYQLVQFLDEGYQTHRWPELLPLYAQQLDTPQADPLARLFAIAVTALHCSHQWGLHTHYRRILTAACISAQLNPSPRYWQKKHLTQPLWLSALAPLTGNAPEIVVFRDWIFALTQAQLSTAPLTHTFSPLLNGRYRYRFWLLLKQGDTLPVQLTGQKMVHTKTEQTAVVLGFEGSNCTMAMLHKLDRPFSVPAEKSHFWTKTSRPLTTEQYHTLLQHPMMQRSSRQKTQQTPRALLKAITRYANANGSLNAVTQHIKALPILANSLYTAVQESPRLGDSEAARMDLKQAYLWLGSKRASVILATAFLQYQFSLNTIPLHKLLMQQLGLLTTLLQRLSHATGVSLPTPAPLLALLSGADLFRHHELLKSARWPQPKQLSHCYSTSWIGVPLATHDFRRSQQLIQRWRLPTATQRMLDPRHSENTDLNALCHLAHYLTAATYFPQTSLSQSTQATLESSYQTLQLTPGQLQQIKTDAAHQSHCYCPL